MTISPGNRKIGATPSLSFPPIASCAKCPCHSKCYAMKAWRMYPSVRVAWTRNLEEYRENPAYFFHNVAEWIDKRRPEYFRYCVAGDAPDRTFFAFVVKLAIRFPETRFLMFTKRHSWLPGNPKCLPSNLTLVASMWPGWGDASSESRARLYPVAWCQDGTESRIPEDATPCPGKCDTCRVCWGATNDVVFDLH